MHKFTMSKDESRQCVWVHQTNNFVRTGPVDLFQRQFPLTTSHFVFEFAMQC